MEKELAAEFAELLRAQRDKYLYEHRKAEEDLESIAAERESEPEEHAQEEQAARALKGLDDRTLRAVEEIDAALERILKGRYGVCEACGKDISLARLRALPETRYCKDCAVRYEQPLPAPAEEPEAPAPLPVPPDLTLLDDAELEEAIREHLKEDGRVDTQELRIVCRKGTVHLSGALPSEPERLILLQIITDVLGIKEVVDRIQVEPLLWEREDRSREKPPEEIPPWEEPPGTEDIIESSEEGKEFVPPAEPPPEEE
ncbi:MAG TPA: TraR/DksA C4-type zinc finger protein [candidate division Zixibacteria bacterium]|nr:TraR/DksA C4-type zinc finger protein [candidate division Zixibacteria bacterium]